MAIHKKRAQVVAETFCGITVVPENGGYNVDLTYTEADVTCQACLDATPVAPSQDAPIFAP